MGIRFDKAISEVFWVFVFGGEGEADLSGLDWSVREERRGFGGVC